MEPILIKKSQYLGHVYLPALHAWQTGTSPSLLVESRSPEKRLFDEERSRCAAETLSGPHPRFGEFQDFERAFWHGESPSSDPPSPSNEKQS